MCVPPFEKVLMCSSLCPIFQPLFSYLTCYIISHMSKCSQIRGMICDRLHSPSEYKSWVFSLCCVCRFKFAAFFQLATLSLSYYCFTNGVMLKSWCDKDQTLQTKCFFSFLVGTLMTIFHKSTNFLHALSSKEMIPG